jgi:F-type H+-transporting ATPase subunit b
MAEPAEGGAAAVGLPQLDVTTFPSQIFWLIVSLVVLYLVVTRLALPKIVGAIEDRADAIEDDLDRAAQYKRKAELAEKAYEKALADAKAKAQEIAAKARADVAKQIAAAMAKADAQIAAKAAESEARIREIRDGALASVEAVAAETAEALVERFIPGAGAADAVRAAVQTRLQG